MEKVERLEIERRGNTRGDTEESEASKTRRSGSFLCSKESAKMRPPSTNYVMIGRLMSCHAMAMYSNRNIAEPKKHFLQLNAI